MRKKHHKRNYGSKDGQWLHQTHAMQKEKNMIIFTSFKKSYQYAGQKFSVARYQPKGFHFTELSFFAAEDENGDRIKLGNSDNSIAEYKKAFRKGCKARWAEIEIWLKALKPEDDLVLCCWCPYSKGSEKQLKDTGVFACHTGLIAQMIKKHRPDIRVALDEDREKHLVKDWSIKSDPLPQPLPQAQKAQPVAQKPQEQPYRRVMFSRKLNDRIVIAENEIAAKILKNPEGYAIYTKTEAALLKGKDTETVMAVHNIKKVFNRAMVLKIQQKEA